MAKVKDRYGDKLKQLVPKDIDVDQVLGIKIPPEDRPNLTWQDVVEWQDIQSASRGSPKSIQSVTDRAFGKVTQVVENLNLNMNYIDFLDALPEPDKAEAIEVEAVVVEKTEETDDALSSFL